MMNALPASTLRMHSEKVAFASTTDILLSILGLLFDHYDRNIKD